MKPSSHLHDVTLQDSSDYSLYKNICFIDSMVLESDSQFTSYLNTETYPVIYKHNSDREQLKTALLRNFTHIDRVSFVFHGPRSGQQRNMNNRSFIHNQPFFSIEDCHDTNQSYLVDLFAALTVNHVDFLACNLLQHQEWKDFFGRFSNIIVGASDDATGNMKYGGDWMMENTMEDVRNIYFNAERIANFAFLLASKVKVGLAYAIGGRGDKSFNDSAAAGLVLAKKKFGVTAKEVALTTGSDSDREDKLIFLVKAGYNPIIAVGFLYAGPIKAIASHYPNVQFAIIDDASVDLDNVAGLVFAEEQGSYLAGVAAALASKSGKVGFIGGVRIPRLQKSEAGFVAGVNATKKSATVDVKYVTEPPDFSGFNYPAKAKVIARGMFDNGIDVIYSAAGGSGAGNFAAATDAAKAGKKVWTIGVDSDQYLSASAAEKKNMLTSMIKRVDRAVYDVIATAVEGSSVKDVLDAKSGIYGRVYNLALDGVGVSYSGGYITKYKAQIHKAAAAIKSGKIKV